MVTFRDGNESDCKESTGKQIIDEGQMCTSTNNYGALQEKPCENRMFLKGYGELVKSLALGKDS